MYLPLSRIEPRSMNNFKLSVCRFDPWTNSYHYDMEGNGVICSAVDILPTEFAKEVFCWEASLSLSLSIRIVLVVVIVPNKFFH